jgi:hypothetical protein
MAGYFAEAYFAILHAGEDLAFSRRKITVARQRGILTRFLPEGLSRLCSAFQPSIKKALQAGPNPVASAEIFASRRSGGMEESCYRKLKILLMLIHQQEKL